MLRGVDLVVARGEVFGLLGPNGAGKTTTVEILEGFRRSDGGTVRVLGFDPATHSPELRARTGVVLQECGFPLHVRVGELIDAWRSFYPTPRPLEELLGIVELTAERDTVVRRLSGGQRRRLDFALALAGDPELIFLDEPTTGFDPSARRGAWELVRRLTGGGTTIVLTTHYMDEAQALADRVAVLANGRIVAVGTPDSIGGRNLAAVRVRFRLPAGVRRDELPMPAPGEDDRVEIRTEDELRVLHALTGWALDRGTKLEGLTVDRPSLEDVYLSLTGDVAGGDEVAVPAAAPA